jgi:hypothetical protein
MSQNCYNLYTDVKGNYYLGGSWIANGVNPIPAYEVSYKNVNYYVAYDQTSDPKYIKVVSEYGDGYYYTSSPNFQPSSSNQYGFDSSQLTKTNSVSYALENDESSGKCSAMTFKGYTLYPWTFSQQNNVIQNYHLKDIIGYRFWSEDRNIVVKDLPLGNTAVLAGLHANFSNQTLSK